MGLVGTVKAKIIAAVLPLRGSCFCLPHMSGTKCLECFPPRNSPVSSSDVLDIDSVHVLPRGSIGATGYGVRPTGLPPLQMPNASAGPLLFLSNVVINQEFSPFLLQGWSFATLANRTQGSTLLGIISLL